MSLSEGFKAGSTGIITFAFKNEDGNATVPMTARWSLKKGGAVVNEKEDVTLAMTSPSIDIVLSGNDLITGKLTIIIEGTYNSSLAGETPFREWVDFYVLDV